MDIQNMTDEEIEHRIEELEEAMEYETKRLSVCGYGHSDLLHLESLKNELETLENQRYN